ncbi:MAG: MaoC family dehydratase [Candidatus Binatia bacterium]|nr:MaoC family dehydratase [Candidatus Binatia bacterium]
MSALAPTKRFDQVADGEELPELAIELTPTLIISTAIASRDYQDVHHDIGLAQQRGTKNIFMNILTTNGLVQRYVNDWAGPEAFFKAIQIKLGAPNYAGDTMTLTGRVTARTEDGGVVDIEVIGKNSIGKHVTAAVRLALPIA